MITTREMTIEEKLNDMSEKLHYMAEYIGNTITPLVNADGCEGCAFMDMNEWEMPCAKCKRNCKDYWRAKVVE